MIRGRQTLMAGRTVILVTHRPAGRAAPTAC